MEEKSFFQRLRNGLSKTRESWGEKLGGLVRSRQWDEEALEAVEEILISADVGTKATQKLIEALRRQRPDENQPTTQGLFLCLQRELINMLKGSEEKADQSASPGNPWVVMFLGVNGVGKTTTIGKIAARYREEGKKVLLVAADTFRAAAIEQLEVWGKRVEAEVVKHQPGADPSAVAFDGIQAAKKRSADVVLIDTAGRLHTKVHLVEELKKIRRVIAKAQAEAPHETLLVLDATTGQNGLQQARVFKDALEITGVVLTKLDGTAKGGVIIGIRQELGVPVRYIGVGEAVDDLQPFDAMRFVQALFDDH